MTASGAPTPPIELDTPAGQIRGRIDAKRVELDGALLRKLGGACATVLVGAESVVEARRIIRGLGSSSEKKLKFLHQSILHLDGAMYSLGDIHLSDAILKSRLPPSRQAEYLVSAVYTELNRRLPKLTDEDDLTFQQAAAEFLTGRESEKES